jgi:sterol desaturase/sphingolipid hydroxylase (fatty acid hydroxylase superfamily)
MFYLAPHPKLDRPRRGSPVMFTIPWVEKYFSRVRPWHVVAIWGPVTLWMLWRARHLAPLAIAGWFAAGVLGWTLLEYVLHRGIFHFKPRESSELQKDLSFLIHGIHHDYPWDPDRLVMPPTVSAIIAVAVWFAFKPLLGAAMPAFFAGLVAGYVWYDLTHYYLHYAAPTTNAGKWLRKYHLVHHFQTPNIRYGITTPLWDVVFGTYPRDRYQGLPDDEARLEAGA